MGQFKPMVKMMTTEPSVELKLKKGGKVAKKADGGMMGGMPIGALLQGACVDAFGVRAAVLVPVVGMAIVMLLIVSRTQLWHVRRGGVLPSRADPAAR